MPFPVAAVIGAAASLIGSKVAADQANLANAQANSRAALGQGDDDDFKPFTKYTETLRTLNEDPSSLAKVEGYKRPSLFASPEDAAATRSRVESPLKAGAQYSAEDIKGSGPSGNVYESAPGGEGGGEGFNMDNALQYAALAAQLGSMFAPPAPPPPPRAGGGGGQFNAQPFTLRMLGGR